MGEWGMNSVFIGTTACLVFVWAIAFSLLLPKSEQKRKTNLQGKLSKVLGFDNVQSEFENVGWRLNFREYLLIVGFSSLIGLGIAYFVGNIFLVIAGITCSFLLPRYIVLKVKKKKRMALLIELPDNLKILTSKLLDFPSVQAAIEAALPDMTGETRKVFERVYASLSVSISIDRALGEAAEVIKMQKFTNYIEKLIVTNTNGFHHESIKSLKQTIDGIVFDIRTITQLEVKNRSKKRTFWVVVLGTWVMTFMVSKLNTDSTNIFVDTWYGQIFVASLFASTMFSIVKADDFLSLNLDEL